MVEEKTSSLDGLSKEDILNKDDEENISYNRINHLIEKWISFENKKIPKVNTKIHFKDKLGSIGVRVGINRLNYKIPTGLYAVGNPDEKSKVIVTANYKLTFDTLRKNLEDLNLWILVLDTKGINVWCAAGKGSFGSRELIYQIEKWNLKELIQHNEIILPQLGATSMEPHKVKEYTGFNIKYGPITAEDLKKYLLTNKINEDMREVKFPLKERLKLAPMELVLNSIFLILSFVAVFFINILLNINLYELLYPVVISLFLGSIVFPAVLPQLPFKSFSLKSMFIVIPNTMMLNYYLNNLSIEMNLYFKIGYLLLIGLFIIMQAFKFTGSTTFTSFSGVKKEARYFNPIMYFVLIISPILMIYGGVTKWL